MTWREPKGLDGGQNDAEKCHLDIGDGSGEQKWTAATRRHQEMASTGSRCFPKEEGKMGWFGGLEVRVFIGTSTLSLSRLTSGLTSSLDLDLSQCAAKMGGELTDVGVSGLKNTTPTPLIGGLVSTSIPPSEGLSPSRLDDSVEGGVQQSLLIGLEIWQRRKAARKVPTSFTTESSRRTALPWLG
ncbi:hypothetical protein RHSIM_Rhsim08G0128000 [Rhododendron simsii]|uniref:Uncharacterized protein n=1 Tax=Rhododendron simsii TaxID=118357 RepID=A0A834GSQ1_RHOSS|nr:hypothetical protein RHSIM_Rhsim08G0128000 [Rhododendron simsii]